MSAFVVSREHIDAIVATALYGVGQHSSLGTKGPGAMELRYYGFNGPTQLGQALERENYASVNYRYREQEEPRGPYEWPMDAHGTPADVPYRVKLPTVAEAFRLVRCYVYQACEHPTWDESSVRRFCDDLSIRLAMEMAKDCKVWSWDHPTFPTTDHAATA
jgi:hypothetical protein